MEFMMIRAVKNGASVSSGNELPKGSLGIISTSNSTTTTTNNFHGSLYQQRNLGIGQPVTIATQQLGGSQVPGTTVGLLTHQPHHSGIVSNADFAQNNAFGGLKFYATSNSVNANSIGGNINWSIDNNVLFQGTNSFDVLATQIAPPPLPPTPQVSKKNQPKLLPVVIKSKDTLDRIALGSSSQPGMMQGMTANSSNYGCDSNVFNNTPSSNQLNSAKHGETLVPKGFKVNHRLWEVTYSNPSSESVIKPRGKHKSPEEFRAHLTKILSKRTKIEQRSDGFCHTPNLLRKIHSARKCDKSNNGRSRGAEGKQGNQNSVSVPSQSALPTENLFLKLYDPIKLLRKLRLISPSKGPTAAILKNLTSSKPKFKPVTVNHFPTCSKPITSTDLTKISTWKKRRKKYSGCPTTSTQSKSESVRLPKHCTPKRIVKVKYRSSYTVGSSISENKLRVIAAVYLKRAVLRLRGQAKIDSRVLQKRMQKMKEERTKRRTKNASSACLLPTSRQFNYMGKQYTQTVVKLPPPLLIDSQKVVLKESPSMLHTLDLLRHKRELQDRLETFETDGTVQKVGPLPEKLEDEGSSQLDGVLLNGRQVKHVISQKLLINLAIVGFTNTKLRPLEVLADATANFLVKTAQRLKDVSEMEMHSVDHGFPDAMERVLIETGFGGVRGMEEFNRTKLVEYGQRMEEQCLHLRRQYAYKVRSKVGMMSNVNNSTTNSNAPVPSSSSTSTISVPSSSILSGNNISSSTSLPTVMLVSGSGSSSSGISTAATGAVTNKATLMAKPPSMSSQPMSPGNSVLAEMLSSQEEHPVRTPQGCPQSPLLGALVGAGGTADRQLEELMGAPPPNVEIRPNSFPHPHHLLQPQRQTTVAQQQQQHVPLQQLLASLTQQQQSPQSRPQQPLLPPPSPQQQASNPYVTSLYASSPPLTPPTPPHHLSQKVYQQPPQLQQTLQQGSSQGQSQPQQSHLTQLLQRPITSQPSPNPTLPSSVTSNQQQQHHLILHHHHPQQQQQPAISQATQYTHQTLHPSRVAVPTQQNQLISRNVTLTPNSPNLNISPGLSSLQGNVQAQVSRQLGSAPPQSSVSKVPSQVSSLSTGEVAYSSSTATIPTLQLARTLTNVNGTPVTSNNLQTAGKLITIIRSSTAGTTHQQGILVNSNHQQSQEATVASVAMDNSTVSINLGGSTDVDTTGEMVPNSTSTNSASASKAKLNETISQRNLLRLNFEQVPSGAGNSTVLLSSSSVSAPAAALSSANNTSNSVQFIGKLSDTKTGRSQTVAWNNANTFS